MKFIISILFLCALAPTTTSCNCGAAPTATQAVTVAISCTEQNAADIAKLYNDFKSKLLGGGSGSAAGTPDWTAIEADAEAAGEAIGGCALAEFVQDFLAAPAVTTHIASGSAGSGSAAVEVDNKALAKAALEHFRAKMAHGAVFKTKNGDI